MREIKFRAWDKQEKRMIYSGIHDRNWYGTPKNDAGGCHTLRGKMPEDRTILELMQFTGLHDKNGKEIYESDIVRFQHHKPSVCVWSGWGWGWEVNTPKGKRVYESGVGQFRQDEFDADYRLNSAEIIGNIYESPELVKP